MKVVCNIGRTKYKEKPKGRSQLSMIQKETSEPKEIELEQLAILIGMGCNFRPAAISGTKKEGWLSQQVFGLDIDNKEESITPNEAIQKAIENKLPPAIVYETFSSKTKEPRYRMLFVTDRKITNLTERNSIQRFLMDLYGKAIDRQCIDENRIFFGTDKGILYADYEAILDTEYLLANVPKVEEIKSHTRRNIKPQGHIATPSNDNVEAIRRHDVEYLRKKLNYEPKEFETRDDFFNFLYKGIDLAELLEVDARKNFSCVLPSHNGTDENPSASVFLSNRSKMWRYKCFAEHEGNHSLNTRQVVESIGNFGSTYKATEFIKKIYNLSIKKTEWQIEQEENLDDITRYLSGNEDNSFEDFCPTAAKNTRRYIDLFRIIIGIARDNIYPQSKTEDGRIIFAMSVRQIAKAAGKTSIGKVNNQINLLVYHGMLEKVQDCEVPRNLIRKALESKQANHKSHTQFYAIPSWIVAHLQYIENQGLKWQQNGYRVGGISYEMFLRTEGVEVASRIYPQNSKVKNSEGIIVDRQTTEQSNELHEVITEVILHLIQTEGYATEKKTIEIIKAEGIKGKHITGVQIKRSIADIMNCNLLKKCRANNELKALYGIESKGYPLIIVKDE